MKLSAFGILSLLCIAACSATTAEEAGSSEDSVTSAKKLACVAPANGCAHAGAGDLGACLESITLTSLADGKLRLDVKKRRSSGSPPEAGAPISVSSTSTVSVSGDRIEASWEDGEHWLDVKKERSGAYKGTLTLEQDFPFDVVCTASAGAGDAGATYDAGAAGRDAGATYEPCAAKACGDSCRVCPPDDPNCFETAVLKQCNAQGACVPGRATCGGATYSPCGGKACGDSCRVCPPDDLNCFETAVLKQCNAQGACVPGAAVCR
jgi:hypothetical protein